MKYIPTLPPLTGQVSHHPSWWCVPRIESHSCNIRTCHCLTVDRCLEVSSWPGSRGECALLLSLNDRVCRQSSRRRRWSSMPSTNISANFACSESSYRLRMYSSVLSPSLWVLLWKMARSWITFFFGTKYLSNSCRTLSKLFCCSSVDVKWLKLFSASVAIL